jgi:hypothetical protein
MYTNQLFYVDSLVVGTPPNATFVHPIFINDSWICGPRSGFNTSTLF